MPRVLVRAPDHDRNRSLGWLGTSWMEFFVRHGPGAIMGHPVQHGDEYTGVIVDAYALTEAPTNNHMRYDSVFFSRPKGCDKSGLGARLALFETFGPARFSGRWAEGGEIYEDPWGFGFVYEYQPGEPIGRHVTAPFVRCMATESGQVGNVFKTIRYNLEEKDFCPLAHVPGVDVGLERVLLPWGGEIQVSTASAGAKDGGKETFVIFDETHRYITPELHEMYEIVVNNLDKRKKIDGTWFLEATTMFRPGENSVAEKTYGEAEALRTGKKQRGGHRLMYDHRYGHIVDLRDEAQLRIAIREAYGEALLWMDEESLVNAFYDTRRSAANNRRFFLNAQTSAADAWVTHEQLEACHRPDLHLRDGDLVCLGFDGSVREDSTALVAVRVSDGHTELLAVWEKPSELGEDDEWQVDRVSVDNAVAKAMYRFQVAGMYADPAHWQDYLDKWNNEYGDRMQVRATAARPLEWWTNRPRAIVAALERLHEAICEKRTSFTPAADRVGREAELAETLQQHTLNARRREQGKVGITIGKIRPKSPKKIDAAMAWCLAWECRNDAVAAGVQSAAETFFLPRRLR